MHLTAVLPVMAKIKGREKEKTHQYTPHHAQYKPPPSEIFPTVGYTTCLLYSPLPIFLCSYYSFYLKYPLLMTTTWILFFFIFYLFFANAEKNHRWCYFRQTFQNSSHFPAEVMDSLKNCNALLQNASVTHTGKCKQFRFQDGVAGFCRAYLIWHLVHEVQLCPRDYPLLSVTTANKWSINLMFPFESANRPRNPQGHTAASSASEMHVG